MDAESQVWDEITDRLVVIYNHMRLERESIDQHKRQIAKGEAEYARLEGIASQYEALFSEPEVEGTPA